MCRNRHHRLWMALALVLALPAAAQEAPPPVTPPPAALPAAKPADPILFRMSDLNSLFYTPEDLRKIAQAYAVFQARNLPAGETKPEGEDYLDSLTSAPPPGQDTAIPAVTFYTYPQFFLESIVYHTPQDWAVWVNGQKLDTNTQQFDTLRILDIGKNRVTLEWSPEATDKIEETLKKTTPSPEVEIDTLQRTVTFTLFPNQTFSSYVMRVLEGKVLPVTVKIETQAPPGTLPAEARENKEGLRGLIGAYEKLGGKEQ